jgi:hypothetical protein
MSRPDIIEVHSSASLLHREELLGNRVAQGLRALVRAAKRHQRHRVAQHAGADRVSLGVVGVQEAFQGDPVDPWGALI